MKKFFMLMSFAWCMNIGAMMAGDAPAGVEQNTLPVESKLRDDVGSEIGETGKVFCIKFAQFRELDFVEGAICRGSVVNHLHACIITPEEVKNPTKFIDRLRTEFESVSGCYSAYFVYQSNDPNGREVYKIEEELSVVLNKSREALAYRYNFKFCVFTKDNRYEVFIVLDPSCKYYRVIIVENRVFEAINSIHHNCKVNATSDLECQNCVVEQKYCNYEVNPVVSRFISARSQYENKTMYYSSSSIELLNRLSYMRERAIVRAFNDLTNSILIPLQTKLSIKVVPEYSLTVRFCCYALGEEELNEKKAHLRSFIEEINKKDSSLLKLISLDMEKIIKSVVRGYYYHIIQYIEEGKMIITIQELQMRVLLVSNIEQLIAEQDRKISGLLNKEQNTLLENKTELQQRTIAQRRNLEIELSKLKAERMTCKDEPSTKLWEERKNAIIAKLHELEVLNRRLEREIQQLQREQNKRAQQLLC